jgi:hypothetical protein
MKSLLPVALILAGFFPSVAFTQMQRAVPATPSDAPAVGSVLDSQLTFLEGQFVSAAEAMPGDKYSFVPAGSSFDGVRTFALEVKHVATVNMGIYSAILGQDLPAGVDFKGAANGPESIVTKGQILKYLKDSFALGHKALISITAQNAVAPLAKSPIPFMKTRVDLATFSLTHASDHYGQMVVYLRMNGIAPPASNGQPPANPKAQ